MKRARHVWQIDDEVDPLSKSWRTARKDPFLRITILSSYAFIHFFSRKKQAVRCIYPGRSRKTAVPQSTPRNLNWARQVPCPLSASKGLCSCSAEPTEVHSPSPWALPQGGNAASGGFHASNTESLPWYCCWWFRNPKQPPGMYIKPC